MADTPKLENRISLRLSPRDRTRTNSISAPPSLDPSKRQIHELPRGGVIVNTIIGNVQVGIPPETIKGISLPLFLLFLSIDYVLS
jgi:hypothetical protein